MIHSRLQIKTTSRVYKTSSITWRLRNGNFFPRLIRRSSKLFFISSPVLLLFSWNTRGSERWGEDRFILGILHKFRSRIYGKKIVVVKEDWNVKYFPFQAAVRTTISFFKTLYHTIQMIQFRSAPESITAWCCSSYLTPTTFSMFSFKSHFIQMEFQKRFHINGAKKMEL